MGTIKEDVQGEDRQQQTQQSEIDYGIEFEERDENQHQMLRDEDILDKARYKKLWAEADLI